MVRSVITIDVYVAMASRCTNGSEHMEFDDIPYLVV